MANLAFAFGVLLHGYTALFKASSARDTFTVGLLLWSLVPYLVGRFALHRLLRPATCAAFLGACLAADLFVHWAVFIQPRSSTAALGLVAMPLWNLFAVGPAAATAAWAISSIVSRLRKPAA